MHCVRIRTKGPVAKLYLKYIMYHDLNVYNEVHHLFKVIKKKTFKQI